MELRRIGTGYLGGIKDWRKVVVGDGAVVGDESIEYAYVHMCI